MQWLKEAPRRTLGPSDKGRKKFFNLIVGFVREGTYRGEKARKGNYQPRKKAAKVRPDWMGDKSKLPLKPPGR